MGTCSKLFGSVGFAAPFCLIGMCSKLFGSVGLAAPFSLMGSDCSFSGEETRAIGGSNGGLSDGVRGRSGVLLSSGFRDV